MADRIIVHNGLNGLDGRDGKSAYQLAVAAGFTGTVEQWLKSLRGPAGGQKGDNGQDGRDPELHRSETHLQWRYVGDEEWNNLLDLQDIKGKDGRDGIDGLNGKDGTNGKDGKDGQDGREVELSADSEWIRWRYVGESDWIDLVPLELLKGKDGRDGKDGRRVGIAGGLPASSTANGREVELRNSGTYIQWRYVGDAAWTDLVALADITGADGATGAGYQATSTTSLATAGSGSKSFTTQSGLAYTAGARIRATSAGTGDYMEGLVTSYSGTTLVVTMDRNSGAGTHADWNINLAGDVGSTGAAGTNWTPSVITYQPSGDVNDAAPTGWSTATYVRLDPTTSVVITGFSAGSSGEIKTLVNVSSEYIVAIADRNAGSTAANRVACANAVERGHVLLFPGDSVSLCYDSVSTVWRAQSYNTKSVPGMGMAGFRGYMPAAGSTSGSAQMGMVFGGSTATARALGTGSYRAQQSRIGYATAASAASTANQRTTVAHFVRGDSSGRGGGLIKFQWTHDNVPTTGAAVFVGLLSSTSAIGNVDPSSLTNMVGFAKDAADTYMQWMVNDGTGTATKVDLGANYPLGTTAVFRGSIHHVPGGGGFAWVIERLDDLTVAPKAGYSSSDIPANSVLLADQQWIGNRAVAQLFSIEPCSILYLRP